MSKIYTRLTLSYIMISVLMVAMTVFLSNTMMLGIFRKYEDDVLNRKVSVIMSDLVSDFNPVIAGWNSDDLEKIGKKALEQRLIVQIKDLKGNSVWSAYNYKGGVDAAIVKNISINHEDIGHDRTYREDKYKIKLKDIYLGELSVGYYSSYDYTGDDELVSRLNLMFLYISLSSFVIAAIIGLYMSKEIASPVVKVTAMTEMIAKNDFKEEIDYHSDIYEISALISSINYLSKTLEESRNLRKRMTSDIAHELRTPLTVVQSHIEAIMDGIWKPTKERLQSCYDEVTRLGKLVENLKKIDDLDSGSFVLDLKEFSLNDLLNGISLNFGAEFRKRKIDFLLQQKDDVMVYSDNDYLRQVIINLLSNAIKYTSDGGKIILAGDYDENFIYIKVSDNGIGIAKKDIPFIFERLYRADTSRSKNTGGFGIGLTIAKYRIEALGGTINVSSEQGKGSVFTVTLPRKAA